VSECASVCLLHLFSAAFGPSQMHCAELNFTDQFNNVLVATTSSLKISRVEAHIDDRVLILCLQIDGVDSQLWLALNVYGSPSEWTIKGGDEDITVQMTPIELSNTLPGAAAIVRQSPGAGLFQSLWPF
jgi:hypothetical protein